MQRFVYLLAYPFLWGISRLPFPLLYVLSDVLYFILYHLLGYRRKVVRANLKLVFPDWNEKQVKSTEKAFYRHLCDMFLEMIKTMGLREKDLVERFVFTNLEVIQKYEKAGKSVMAMFPHYASWEWVPALNIHLQSKGYAVYQPINNRYFDKLVRDIRAKFGVTLITTKETPKTIALNTREGITSSYGILSDQSPMLIRTRHWGNFMGIEVPMHIGAEGLCKRYDIPAVYLKVEKVKRGYYQASFIVLSEDPKSVPNYEITEAFFKETERAIREAPEYYFWTHRRWKHAGKKPKEEKKELKEEEKELPEA